MAEIRFGALAGAARPAVRRLATALLVALGTLAATPRTAVANDADPVNPIARARFYVNPGTRAARQAADWPHGRRTPRSSSALPGSRRPPGSASGTATCAPTSMAW
jgi:hypothetical protein